MPRPEWRLMHATIKADTPSDAATAVVSDGDTATDA
jgi:hypothetical protein